MKNRIILLTTCLLLAACALANGLPTTAQKAVAWAYEVPAGELSPDTRLGDLQDPCADQEDDCGRWIIGVYLVEVEGIQEIACYGVLERPDVTVGDLDACLTAAREAGESDET